MTYEILSKQSKIHQKTFLSVYKYWKIVNNKTDPNFEPDPEIDPDFDFITFLFAIFSSFMYLLELIFGVYILDLIPCNAPTNNISDIVRFYCKNEQNIHWDQFDPDPDFFL